MKIHRGAALIEHIWKNVKVNRSTLLELSFAHTWEHFKKNNIWNICQLNILNWVKNWKAPNVFLSRFLRPLDHYPSSFSRSNYIVHSIKLTKSKYRITVRAPKLWNIILNIEEQFIENPAILKATIKAKLVLLEMASYIFKIHM